MINNDNYNNKIVSCFINQNIKKNVYIYIPLWLPV